jgi:hypothetical protein
VTANEVDTEPEIKQNKRRKAVKKDSAKKAKKKKTPTPPVPATEVDTTRSESEEENEEADAEYTDMQCVGCCMVRKKQCIINKTQG